MTRSRWHMLAAVLGGLLVIAAINCERKTDAAETSPETILLATDAPQACLGGIDCGVSYAVDVKHHDGWDHKGTRFYELHEGGGAIALISADKHTATARMWDRFVGRRVRISIETIPERQTGKLVR